MTVCGCMHAYQNSFTYNVSSSYFDAASLTVALLAAFFRPAWGHGLAGDAWSGMEGVVWPFELHDEQLQLASSGNQFSKIGPIALLPASR